MRFHRDDRAVRNIVGFTLTFSIIILSVGLVATLGYGQLGAISENERVENAERGMDLITTNLQQLEQGRSTVQVNELDLSGGSLTVVDGPTATVGATENVKREIDVRALQYRVGDTAFTYENGALIRTGPQGNSVVLEPPSMRCTDERAMLSIVTIDADSEEHFGGNIVTVNASTSSRELVFPRNRTGIDSISAVDQANVTVESDREAAWETYLERNGNWTRTGGGTFVCDSVEAVYVRRVVVSVAFLS